MGRWLSGEFLKDKTQLLDFHSKLSEKFNEYAHKTKTTIKEPKGKLVYAGGDDIMAFVNLNHLLPVMRDLRAEFPKFEELGFAIKDNHKSTASAGVVIAHYKTPLSVVLRWARNMGKEAKTIDSQKDAFAMAVLRHSGEISRIVFKWQYNSISTIGIMNELIDALHSDFSNTFIKNVSNEFSWMMDKNGKYDDRVIFLTELRRLIKRSCMIEKKQGENKQDFENRKKKMIDALTGKLKILYENSITLENFFSLLDVADFIERGGTK